MPFDPSQVSGLQLWFAADSGVYKDAGTTLARNGDTVQQWNDLSGNSYTLSQTTSGNKPSLVTNAYKGLPTVQFTGGSYLNTTTFGSPISQPTTIFIVSALLTTSGNQTFFDTNTVTNEQVLLITGGLYAQYAGEALYSFQEIGGTPDTAIHVYECSFNGSTSFTLKDNASLISGSAGSMTLPQLRLGANPSPTSFLNGDICEVVIYNRTLTGTETTNVFNYLQNRWYQAPQFPTSGLVLSCFPNSSETLALLQSADNGVTWSNINGLSYTPNSGETVRDPSLVIINGKFWLAHTSHDFNSGTNFAVASATDGLTYSWVADVDCSLVTGNTAGSRCWAPEWFVDSDGSVHVFFAASAVNPYNDTGFQIYEVHPTNAGYTTWSTPVAVSGSGLPNNMIDPFIVKVGSTYYLWYKNENTKYIKVASSSSLTSGYTVLYSGDWAGWGSGEEGPSLLNVPSVGWRVWMDGMDGGSPGIKYSTQNSGDWTSGGSTTWSALSTISSPLLERHGTVLFASSLLAGSGTASGNSTASAVGASLLAGSGTASGNSTASAVGASLLAGSGTASGNSTASAVGASLLAGSGTASGNSTASAVGASLLAGSGTASGNSTASAVGASSGGTIQQGTGVALGDSVAGAVGVASKPQIANTIYPIIQFVVTIVNIPQIYSYAQPDSLQNIINDLRATTIQIEGVNGNLRDGDTFVLYGNQAIRVKNVYCDQINPPLLAVVSIS